jgi:hypothetical protein
MRRILRLLAVILVLLLIAVAWFWWNRPLRVDMAAYVPADSQVYLESNSLLDVAQAIATTDGWQKLGPHVALKLPQQTNDWLTYLVKTTGMGPALTVIATRAQIAFVILDLTAQGNGDALEYKSTAALVIETHTSQRRVKPAVEKLLTDFAGRAYGQPKFERITLEGNELMRWTAPDGKRRIVASIDGSVVIVANDEKAVAACMAAHHGQRPSLVRRPELEEMRARLNGNGALAFGYVSAPNAARLVSQAAPMVLGRISQGEQLQQLLAAGSSKLLGNVGWSARAAKGGIEDKYFISAKPEVLARLRPSFAPTQTNFQGGWEFLPAQVNSVTSYNLREPATAWHELNAAVSSQLDVLSAVVFTTAFKALLTPYGIDEPDTFLAAIKPDVLSVRLDPQSERALLIAGIASPDSLREFIQRRFGANPRSEKVGASEMFYSPDEAFAGSLTGDYFLLGAPEDVRRSLATHANKDGVTATSARLESLTHYFEKPSAASVVTFFRDSERTKSLITSLAAIRGSQATNSVADVDRIIEDLPYAVTETSLEDAGIERRTRSAFGQFGFLASFLAPRQPSTTP